MAEDVLNKLDYNLDQAPSAIPQIVLVDDESIQSFSAAANEPFTKKSFSLHQKLLMVIVLRAKVWEVLQI